MTQADDRRNRILDRLPGPDYERIAGQAELVTLPAFAVICDTGKVLEYAYFPVSSVLSALIVLENGAMVEAATIGNEGMVGVSLLLGNPPTPHRIVQQVLGETLRIDVDTFSKALKASEALRHLVERFAVTLIYQGSQGAACNQHHSVEERMCRWLLETSDRCGKEEFDITQEFLGAMLGVRRQGVNLTARLLQQAGIIAYDHSHLTILNRRALEKVSCECYGASTAVYRCLMEGT
jgi:CRP-like cAMP-binding protein